MITAIILAAGESKRMGQPKMLLPWGDETVLSHVVTLFREAGLEDTLVVTGGARERVENAISHSNARTIFNKDFATGGMLSSIQCGIRALTSRTQAILIGLGDQPQVQIGTVQKVCYAFQDNGYKIIVPSFNMRRGHPWLVACPLWDNLLKMGHSRSPRDFLNAHEDQIHYVNVDDPGILADLDTPEDYRRWQP